MNPYRNRYQEDNLLLNLLSANFRILKMHRNKGIGSPEIHQSQLQKLSFSDQRQIMAQNEKKKKDLFHTVDV